MNTCRNCGNEQVSALVRERCAPCLAEGIGCSPDKPYTVTTEGWQSHGIPYGSFCKCSKCGEIGRSTITFDFYSSKHPDETVPGTPLVCEVCARFTGGFK